jgi:4-hydroxy-2-oxoheptanedioate aldolase
MIETAEAMENLEAIVATPGLDGVYIGPADLTLGITNGALAPGFDREEPQMLEAIHKIRQAASDAGIRACIHCGTPEYAARALGWGFNMSTLSNDVRLLASQADATVKKARALMNAESSDATPTQTGGY